MFLFTLSIFKKLPNTKIVFLCLRKIPEYSASLTSLLSLTSESILDTDTTDGLAETGWCPRASPTFTITLCWLFIILTIFFLNLANLLRSIVVPVEKTDWGKDTLTLLRHSQLNKSSFWLFSIVHNNFCVISFVALHKVGPEFHRFSPINVGCIRLSRDSSQRNNSVIQIQFCNSLLTQWGTRDFLQCLLYLAIYVLLYWNIIVQK